MAAPASACRAPPRHLPRKPETRTPLYSDNCSGFGLGFYPQPKPETLPRQATRITRTAKPQNPNSPNTPTWSWGLGNGMHFPSQFPKPMPHLASRRLGVVGVATAPPTGPLSPASASLPAPVLSPRLASPSVPRSWRSWADDPPRRARMVLRGLRIRVEQEVPL